MVPEKKVMGGKFQYKSVAWLIISILSSPGHFVIYYVFQVVIFNVINILHTLNYVIYFHTLTAYTFFYIIEFQTINLLKTCTFVFLEMSKIITEGKIKSLTFPKSLLTIQRVYTTKIKLNYKKTLSGGFF